jgi:hypothetical protein
MPEAAQMTNLVQRDALHIELAGLSGGGRRPVERRVEKDVGFDERARDAVDEKTRRGEYPIQVGPVPKPERRQPIVFSRLGGGEAAELIPNRGGGHGLPLRERAPDGCLKVIHGDA